MIFEKRNNAVALNPPNADSHITSHGSNVYWAIFAIMATATLVFSFLMLKTPRGERIFHYITTGIVLIASIAYYTMASDLGGVAVPVEFRNYQPSSVTRQVFYARYIDWTLTTPLLLLDLLLLSGLPYSSIAFVILADLVMIETGLFAALTPSRFKWGYYAFGCFAFFYVAYYVVIVARTKAAAIGSDVQKLYVGISVFTIGLWTLYPIAFGVSEGGNVIASDSEAVFYGVLDVLAKPVFGAWLLWGHKGIGLDRLGLTEHRAAHSAKHAKNDPTSPTPAAENTTATTAV